jgi:hypothetical protein
MMSRVGMAVNVLSAVLGAAVVYAATLTSHYNLGGDWSADFLGGVGGFIMLASLVGIVATAKRWRSILWAHFLSLCALAILLTASTVVILVYGSSRVTEFARNRAGKVPEVFRTRVLGCVDAARPGDANATTLAGLNLTNTDAAAVLQCAVNPEEAQRFWETHLTSLGALGSVLLVVLLANLVSAGYLLFNGGPDDDDAPARRRKKGGREKRRQRRRRDESEDSSSDEGGESVQLARRSSKRDEEEP